MKKNPNKTASVQYQGNLIHFADSWMQAYHGGKVYVCVCLSELVHAEGAEEKKKKKSILWLLCTANVNNAKSHT